MTRAIDWIKRIRVDKLLAVFLAGIFLVFSTACGSRVLAQTADNIRDEVPHSAVTSRYEGGMNDYADVDPRQDTKQTQAKTKALLDKVEQNLGKRANNPDKLGKNYQEGAAIGQKAQQLADNTREAAENRIEGVSKGTQRGLRNIKENTRDAAEDVGDFASRSAENTKQNAKQAARDLAKTTGRSAEDIGKATQRAAKDASDFVKDSVN